MRKEGRRGVCRRGLRKSKRKSWEALRAGRGERETDMNERRRPLAPRRARLRVPARGARQ